jgi:hypothetical protein
MVMHNNNNSTTGYIRIQCLNDPTKPYPDIIFYLHDSDLQNAIDTTYDRDFWIHKIQVSEKEFELVINAIENGKSKIKQPVSSSSVGFVIVRNGKRKFFDTATGEIVREIFNNIITHFQGTDREELVKTPLIQLMMRLGY